MLWSSEVNASCYILLNESSQCGIFLYKGLMDLHNFADYTVQRFGGRLCLRLRGDRIGPDRQSNAV